MVNSIGERLRRAIKEARIDQNELAKRVKVAPGSLSRYINDHRVPRADLIEKIARALNRDPSYFLPPDQGVGVVAEAVAPYRAAPTPDHVLIPEFGVEASAGHGAAVPGEPVIGLIALHRTWARRELGVNPEALVALSVRGESMEPTLRAGDLVLVDRSGTAPTHEGLYVVRIADALLVKRVQVFPDRSVLLTSDHPGFRPIKVEAHTPSDQVAIVGRVVWVGRKV